MLIENSRGGYEFLQGIEPYSCGVVALPGFEIVHVTMIEDLPWRLGFDRIAAHLEDADQDRISLCAIQLRAPQPWTMQGFIDFNTTYCAVLREWNLYVGDLNPIARTNVAPLFEPPSEPVLHAFSYTIPVPDDVEPTLIVAGAGEVEGGILEEEAILRSGETNLEAMREKAAHVMATMDERVRGLQCGWDAITAVDVYTVHPIDGLVEDILVGGMGAARRHGINWLHSRPPIIDIEFEMDMRGVRREIRI